MDFDSFVLAASTADLDEEPAAREYADAVEFRLDLADDGLAALANYEGELPVLVTNRVAWEGGETPDTPERLDTLETAIEHPRVEAVDLELDALHEGASTDDDAGHAPANDAERTADNDARRVLTHAREHDVTVVVSTHDFEGTPDRGTLRSTLEIAAEYGDVAKLATTAQSRSDVLDLLSVTHELTEAGETVATMGMGQAGRHSRAVAPLYGSRIGYAPVDPANATAPGQYDLVTLRRLVERLQYG